MNRSCLTFLLDKHHKTSVPSTMMGKFPSFSPSDWMMRPKTWIINELSPSFLMFFPQHRYYQAPNLVAQLLVKDGKGKL